MKKVLRKIINIVAKVNLKYNFKKYNWGRANSLPPHYSLVIGHRENLQRGSSDTTSTENFFDLVLITHKIAAVSPSIVFITLVSIGMPQILVGAFNLGNCVIQPWLPYWLVVSGCFFLLFMILHLIFCLAIRSLKKEIWRYFFTGFFIFSLQILFIFLGFVWLITGKYDSYIKKFNFKFQ